MANQKFRPNERIKKRADFVLLQKNAQKIHSKSFLAFYQVRLPATQLAMPSRCLATRRIGLTVSRRVGGAVQRNLAKRWFREIWRRNRQLLPDNIDIVFLVKQSIFDQGYQGLTAEFFHLAKRLRRQLQQPVTVR